MTSSNSEEIKIDKTKIAKGQLKYVIKLMILSKQAGKKLAEQENQKQTAILMKRYIELDDYYKDKLADLQEKIEKIIVENVGNHYILSSRDKILKEISKIFEEVNQSQQETDGQATAQTGNIVSSIRDTADTLNSNICENCKNLTEEKGFKLYNGRKSKGIIRCMKCKKKFKPKFLKIKEMGK